MYIRILFYEKFPLTLKRTDESHCHGKYVVYGSNAIDKSNLRYQMNRLSKNLLQLVKALIYAILPSVGQVSVLNINANIFEQTCSANFRENLLM